MLFNYRYVTHSVEKFQEYLDHLVKEVWCKATGRFSVDLLHTELKEIVIAVANDDSIKLDLFKSIRELFNMFKGLTPQQRNQFSLWYDINNDIEDLCANISNKQPATYDDVALINKKLSTHLKLFYRGIWSQVRAWDVVKGKIGDIAEHYTAFIAKNPKCICPYCGFGKIKGPHHLYRNAYDHFLPKGTYPFNAFNFKNLAPICDECNLTYKRAKDPIHKGVAGPRRKAFFSYATVPSGISIAMTLTTQDVAKLKPSEIALQITAPGRSEEVDTWKDVFEIEDRYKAKLCDENDCKTWLVFIIEECANGNLTSDAMLDQVKRASNQIPWTDSNFLKKPFLQACIDAGLIKQANPITTPQP